MLYMQSQFSSACGDHLVCSVALARMIMGIASMTALTCLMAIPSTALSQTSNSVSSQASLDAHGPLSRGITHLVAQKWNAARSEFDAAIALEPTNALAYDYRGCCYFAEGAADSAIRDFSRVIELEPQNYRGYLGRGNSYRAKHSLELALADLGRSIRLNPTNADTYNSRAAIFNEIGDLTNAIKDCSSSLGLVPQDPKVLTMRGHAYWRNADYKLALHDFVSASQTDPANAEALNQLAWIRATCPESSIRDGSAAVKTALRACELTAWQNPRNIDTLAAAYAESGDFKKAIQFQKQAIELSGESIQRMQERLAGYWHARPYREGIVKGSSNSGKSP